jgi:hypothetical protein
VGVRRLHGQIDSLSLSSSVITVICSCRIVGALVDFIVDMIATAHFLQYKNCLGACSHVYRICQSDLGPRAMGTVVAEPLLFAVLNNL